VIEVIGNAQARAQQQRFMKLDSNSV
jgi:hypothetical protein